MMGAIRSSETSVLTRFTRRHIPEHGILRFQTSSLSDMMSQYFSNGSWSAFSDDAEATTGILEPGFN
jgi:hypothetical protein